MGSLRNDDDDDDGEVKPIKKNNPNGCETKDCSGDGSQFMQSTVGFADTFLLEEDVYQNQLEDLGGKTQVLGDLDCNENVVLQTQSVDYEGETQLLDDPYMGGETQLLDDPSYGGETQVLDDFFYGGETQVLDDPYYGGETQVLDDPYYGGETQVLDDPDLRGESEALNDPYLGGETQVLNDFDAVENWCTQLLDDFDSKVVVDSEGEETDRTEVLSDTEALSDDESIKVIGGHSVYEENMRYSSPRKQGEKGLLKETDTLTVQHCSPELHIRAVTPLDHGILETKPGSLSRGFTSVRAASLRASGLAARSRSFMGTSSGSRCIPNISNSSNKPACEDDEVCGIRDMPQIQEESDHEQYPWGCAKVKEVRNRVGSSTVRKLFCEDSPSENKGSTNIDAAEGGSDSPWQSLDNEFAGLSYVDSQEPGDLSQANALDFVDRFLQVNALEPDQGVDHRHICEGNLNPNSIAKGSQSLAKTVNFRATGRESGIFDWDDCREDEGGGDFFSRKKEEFFNMIGRGQRSLTLPRKFKGSKFNQFKEKKEERPNLLDKTMAVAHSDSRLVMRKLKEKGKTVEAAELLKKNLVNEFDEQLNVKFSGEPCETLVTKTDGADMQDVGFDTQIAAEAMEALYQGEPLANQDANDAYQGNKNTMEGFDLCKNASEHHSFQRRASRSNTGTSNGHSKKPKRIGVKSSKDSSVSAKKGVKKFGKQFDVELVKAKPKRMKLNVKEQMTTNGSESLDRMPSKLAEQRQKGTPERSCVDEVDRFHRDATSSGRASVKRQCIQEKIDTLTPVAKRTRQSMISNQLNRAGNATNNSTEEMKGGVEVAVSRDKRKRRETDIDNSNLLKSNKESFKMGSTPFSEVENLKSNHHAQSIGKLSPETYGASIGGVSYPRRRRTRYIVCGQVNGLGSLDAPSKLVARQDTDGHYNNRLKGSKNDAPSTSVDFKRRTRSSSAHAFPDKLGRSLDAPSKLVARQDTDGHYNSRLKGSKSDALNTSVDFKRRTRSSSAHALPDKLGRSELQISDEGFENTALQSANLCGQISHEDMIGDEASKHFDRMTDAEPLLSADGAEVNARLEISPRDRCKQSDSACITPVHCKTPTNAASPICMGNEYLRQSCKKSHSKSCLMEEFNSIIATMPEPVSASKESRKRRDIAHVRALFSHHLDEDIIKQQKKILARLGASVASSISDATHFITDDFVRTRNMLEAIACGKPVVTHLWLESCNQTSCFIDEKGYILRDAKKEKEFGFCMPVSLARACEHPLLQNRRVLITPNTNPGKDIIASLVKAVHGQAVERVGRSALKDDTIPDDLLVLSCDEDYTICVPFLEKGASIYSSELLLNGIVTQRLEYERHRLFEDHVKRTRSTIWLRKDGNKFHPVRRK